MSLWTPRCHRRPSRPVPSLHFWPRGGLWRDHDFLKLWSAETISQFGTQVSQLALPLVAILVLDASAFEVALLGTIEFLPFILFTLPAGVWIDRLPRRPILILGDFGRAALLASIPVAYIADVLTIWQLYGVGFFVGICTVFFDVAYMSYLPALVTRDQIIDGNSKLEISRSAAQVGGPGLGGGLVQLFTAPYAILVDAVSFLGSGMFLLGIRKEEPPPVAAPADGSKPSLWSELKAGMRFVLGNPNLRAQAGCTGTSNFFSNVAYAIILVYLVRELDLSAGVIGLAFSIGSVGSLIAAFSAMRLSKRFGIGPTTIAAGFVWGPATLLIAVAPAGNAAIPFLVATVLLSGFSIVVYNIIQVSYRQAICPPRLQGRMNSVMRFIVWGTIPIGALVGGVLGSWVGLQETIIIGGIGGSLSVLFIVFSPQRHLRDMPEPLAEEDEPLQAEAGAKVPGVVDPRADDPWAPVDETRL
jgi:MFS family permease